MSNDNEVIDKQIEELKRYLSEYSQEYCKKTLDMYKELSELLDSKIDSIYGYLEVSKKLMESFIEDDPEWSRDMQEWFAEKYKLPRDVMKESCEIIETVQSDLESLKTSTHQLFHMQSHELHEALPLARQHRAQRIIERWYRKKGGPRRKDWVYLEWEAICLILDYRQHNQTTDGPPKRISDVYRELKNRHAKDSGLGPMPSEQYFRKLLKRIRMDL